MMRNDYRRALILLRGNESAYSGHVRLERRTLMGSMYFLVQAPAQCGSLRAALVGRDKNGYYACAIGEMQRDSRGQAVLSYNFDPRNICDHELEEYQLIVISCAEGSDCRIVLWGNVCGHADLNWERVRTALCGLYGDGIAREEEKQRLDALPEAPQDAPEDSHPEAEMEQPAEIQADAAEHMHTAGEMLGIDPDLPWPQEIEPLRALFRISAPMENPPDEEYIYIAAAMPPESGYDYSAVGVRVKNGAPVSVRYGLPAAWSVEPPAGLEQACWVGNQNRGWWMTQIDTFLST